MHQIGLPVPGPLFLVAAGALAAGRKRGLVAALGLTVSAFVVADWAWYEAVRRRGDGLKRSPTLFYMQRHNLWRRSPIDGGQRLLAEVEFRLPLISTSNGIKTFLEPESFPEDVLVYTALQKAAETLL